MLGLLADLSEAEKLYETMRLAVAHLQGAKLALPTWFEGLVDRYVRSRPVQCHRAFGRPCARVKRLASDIRR